MAVLWVREVAGVGSKKHLLSSLKFLLKSPHGRLQRTAAAAAAAGGHGSPPSLGGGCCWEVGWTSYGLVQPFSLCVLLPSPIDAAMRLSGADVRAQAPSKHKPGHTDRASLERSVSVSVYTHSTV